MIAAYDPSLSSATLFISNPWSLSPAGVRSGLRPSLVRGEVDPEGTAGNSDRSCSDEKGPFSAKNDSFGPYDTRGGLVSGALWLDCQLRGRLEQARLAGGHGGTRINNNSSKRQS